MVLMKTIPLTQGESAIVDDEMYNTLVSMGSWHFDRYAKRVPTGGTSVYMHRVIIDCPPKMHVDHINPVAAGGGNERSNLRTLCNRCNQGKAAKIEEFA